VKGPRFIVPLSNCCSAQLLKGFTIPSG